jgi:hypothetical protein
MIKNMNNLHIIALLILMLVFSSCAKDITQTPASISTSIPTLKATIIPSATQTATIVPSPTKNVSCPAIDPNLQFTIPEDSGDIENSLLEYLNHGGDPMKIKFTSILEKINTFDVMSVDLNGDSSPEVVISTMDLYESPAFVRLFQCGQNDYRVALTYPEWSTMGSAYFYYVDELFASEPPYLILDISPISGWYRSIQALGWHDDQWQMIPLGDGIMPWNITLYDQNEDGTKEVIFYADSSTGYPRTIISTYAWDGSKFNLIDKFMPPGTARVNYFEDAEAALEQRNPLLAVTYYGIAARDDGLVSISTMDEIMTRQSELAEPYQRAYAYFRIAAIWFWLDRPGVAARYIDEMAEAFPDGKPGNELLQAAQALSVAYEESSDYEASCEKAIEVMNDLNPEIVPQHLGNWDDAEPSFFEATEFCVMR